MADDKAKIDVNFHKTLLAIANSSGDLKFLVVDDTTRRLLVDATTVETPPSSIVDGLKTVSSAGTAEKLSASEVTIAEVTIQALPTNTGKIAVGGSTVDASTGRGTMLGRYSSVTLKIDDLSKIYIDATVNGEGVSYVYLV